MNPIRKGILTASLLGASLAPHAARAATAPTSPAAVVAQAGGRPSASRAGASLSTGLLALGVESGARESPSGGVPSDDASFAQREQAAPQLREFRGGRVYLYVGGGATLLLVLLLILILL